MRGREHLLEALSRELTLVSRHQLVTAARGVLERSAYLMLNRIDVTGPMTARELADALQLEISTVTRQVGAMLREDVVERIPDPSGGPARRLRITETGAIRLAAHGMRRAVPPAACVERTHRGPTGHALAPRLGRPPARPRGPRRRPRST